MDMNSLIQVLGETGKGKGEMSEAIDFIGDIHGHCDELRSLLLRLGYVESGGAFAGGWIRPRRISVPSAYRSLSEVSARLRCRMRAAIGSSIVKTSARSFSDTIGLKGSPRC